MKISTITWADLARLKKAAKAAKDTLPDLTYMQRLDAIASSEYGVRHFHELQKRYDAQVASHLDVDGGAHHCRFCSFTFDGTLPADIKAHSERHQLFEEAQAVLGFVPMPYKEREQVKRTGYEWMFSSDPGIQRRGALAILLSHFERSMERAVGGGRWHKHPHFTEYLAHALPGAAFVPESVRQRLAKEFGEQPGVIAAGSTDWPSQVTVKLSHSPADAAASVRLRENLSQAARAAAEASIPA
ncbi:hypothetical protein C8241_03460 [Paracidovorax avenae]|uniref:hypothetical protein n=1 Tax=Paracidovorax avenae TaxID=80867 RepID=UPI000D177524|nr:hypothetical protein [Paracidovorax avenae]AVS60887.1 hypothetical protein C8241_03460 [Paracidovorax avenae]